MSEQNLQQIIEEYSQLGIQQQLDYDKFYLYSIITHSTAIEGSTVTEVEAQLLFDEGITSSKRTMTEQMMNLDLKNAYEYGIQTEIDQFNNSMNGNNVKMVDKSLLKQKLVDKLSKKTTLAEKLIDILIFMTEHKQITTEELVEHFSFTPTTAKRYLRQLTEFGYLEALGGNKNRSYKLKEGEL